MSAFAVSGAAQHPVPFKGTFHGNDIDKPGPTPDTIVVVTNGTGLGTHLGQFLFTQEITLDINHGSDTGWARLVAANGDTIDVTITGQGYPTGTPFEFDVKEDWTITAGTGRFAGSQGRAHVERLASGVTFSTAGSFAGTITSPGAVH